MVNFMKKIPAGTFLVPFLLSSLLYTIWPDLLQVGGITQAFLGGKNVTFIIGLITFCSGIGLNIRNLGEMFKRHVVIMLLKLVLVILLSLGFMALFGQEGILGISAIAFVIAITGMNPVTYITLANDYGDDVDKGAFGLVGLFAIPAIPMFIYGILGGGSIDWLPIMSSIIPFIIGVILGNLDSGFIEIFGGGISLLIPIIGFNLGQGVNLISALQSGVSGIILAVIFYILLSPLVFFDRLVLKKDGIPVVGMTSLTTTAAAFPAVVAEAYPEVTPYVPAATSALLTVALVTYFVSPYWAKKLDSKKESSDKVIVENENLENV